MCFQQYTKKRQFEQRKQNATLLQYFVQKHSCGILPRTILFVPYYISSYKSHQAKIRSTRVHRITFYTIYSPITTLVCTQITFYNNWSSVTESLQRL